MAGGAAALSDPLEPGDGTAVDRVMWLMFRAAFAADPCHGLPPADGFDFPVGPPDAAGYYDAQPFGSARR